jgi:hypothetical protein
MMFNVSQRTDGTMWGRFLESGEYSDFLITCGDREFHVHRIIICPRSSYFRMLCKENFMEGLTKRLQLEDEDPDVFQAVLTYLYTGIYETAKIAGEEEEHSTTDAKQEEIRSAPGSSSGCSSSGDSETDDEGRGTGRPATTSGILAHIQLYASGDKFDIRDLKDLSAQMFRNQLIRAPCDQLDVASIIRAVYQSTPGNDKGLRPTLVEYCVQNLDHLIRNDEVADVLSEFGQCSWDLLRSYKEDADSRSRKAVEDQRTAVLEVKRAESQQMKEALAKLQKRDTHLMELLVRHHNCRNCGKVFGAAAQVHGSTGDKVRLRCKGCYTPHS